MGDHLYTYSTGFHFHISIHFYGNQNNLQIYLFSRQVLDQVVRYETWKNLADHIPVYESQHHHRKFHLYKQNLHHIELRQILYMLSLCKNYYPEEQNTKFLPNLF